MRSFEPIERGTAIAVQATLAIGAGLILLFMLNNLPIFLPVGLILGGVFGLLFLRRPDIGMLIVLLARASTDLAVPVMEQITGHFLLAQLVGPNALLVGGVILGGTVFLLSRNLPVLSLPGGRLLTLLIAIGAVGLLLSKWALHSLNEWLPIVSLIPTYAIVAHLFQRRDRLQLVIDTLAASFILPATLGLYQLLIGTGFLIPELGIRRAYGTFVHPGPFGLYLVFIFSVFLCQAHDQSGPRRRLAVVIAAVAGLLLLGTFTRAAWAGAIVVLLTVGLLRNRFLLIAVPLVALAAAGLIPAIGARLADPFGGSFASRVELWGILLHGWLEETEAEGAILLAINRLVGLGPGGVDIITWRLLGERIGAHSDYVRVFVEYGILGLTVYLVLIASMMVWAFRTWRRASDRWSASIALSFLAVALAFPVMGITDHVFAATQNQLYFWTLAGLTTAIGLNQARQ